jgi:hypothetical protein
MMTAVEAARLYVDAVALYDSIPDDEPVSKDAVASFRSDLHQLLMDTFRAEGIEFSDRFEAMRKAFEMVSPDCPETTPLVHVESRSA